MQPLSGELLPVPRAARALKGVRPHQPTPTPRSRRAVAEINQELIVNTHLVGAQAQLDAAREAAATALLGARFENVLAAGSLHGEVIVEAMRLPDGTRDIIANAADRLLGRYVSAMEQRAKER